MPEDDVAEMKACPSCDKTHEEERLIVDVNFEFQGSIPLLVVYYHCPSCGYGWTDAHEPLNRPDLPNDCLPDPRNEPTGGES